MHIIMTIALNSLNTFVERYKNCSKLLSDNASVGDNSTNVPILTGLTNIGRIASNTSNSCALFDNRTAVQCWGRFRMNNHPHGNPNNWTRQNSFTARDIDVAYESVGLLLDNGSVVNWGYGRTGVMGDGSFNYGNNGSVILSNVKDLAYGSHHACYLFDNGTVSCNGKNERGQLSTSVDTSNGCGSGFSLVPTAIDGGYTILFKLTQEISITLVLDNALY